MKDTGNETFEKDISGKKDMTTLVFVHAPWCSSCKAMTPKVEELARDKKDFQLLGLDVERSPQLARRFKVMGVPAFLIFRHGKLVDRKTGEISAERLYKKISAASALDAETAEKNEIRGFFRWPFKKKRG